MPSHAVAVDNGPKGSFADAWVVCAAHGLTHWYPSTFYLLLPLIGNELGLSFGEIGFILTAQYLAGAVTGIPGGIFVDLVGRRVLLMIVSLLCIGVPYALMALSSTYWMLLTCSMLIGIGNNFWHPVALPWLAQQFPARMGLTMALHGMSGNVGDAIAPLVIGAILMSSTWRTAVVLNLLPGVVLFAAFSFYMRHLLATERASHQGGIASAAAGRRLTQLLGSFAQLLRNRTVLWLSIGSGFRSMTQSALLVFLPLYLAREMGYNTFAIGTVMFVLQIAGLIAAPIAGYMSDRVGRGQIVTSSMMMTFVVLVIMIFTLGTNLFVYLVAALGFFLFAVRAVLQAWLLEGCPKNLGGSAIGFLFCTQFLGSALGPLFAGLLADRFGIMAAFYFLGGTIIVANICTLLTPTSMARSP